jgi:hypothetical protein
MRYEFSIETDEFARMESRILALFERLQATPLFFCSQRIQDAVMINGILEIEDHQGERLEPLLFRIEGVRSAKASRRTIPTPTDVDTVQDDCEASRCSSSALKRFSSAQ